MVANMAFSQLFLDILLPSNWKWGIFFLKMMHFLSLNIWYVFYDVLRIQYGFKRMLFLFLLPYHFGFLSFFYLSLANASSHWQSSSSYQLYISVTCIYTPSAVCTICFIVHALLSCALYYFWKQNYFRVGVTVVLPALGELNYRHMSVNVFQHYCCCYCPLGEQNWTLEQELLEKKHYYYVTVKPREENLGVVILAT